MTDVMEDTLILIDVDLNESVPCEMSDHPEPVPATHRAVPECGCTQLLCTDCADWWASMKALWGSFQDGGKCMFCGASFRLSRLVIEPLASRS